MTLRETTESAVNRPARWVVGDFEEKKPGFSEKAGLLKRKITHYRQMPTVARNHIFGPIWRLLQRFGQDHT